MSELPVLPDATPMVYLDHAATTPVLPEVAAVVAEALSHLGNPSSLHGHGRTARARVEQARESIAADLGVHPTEIVFTSSGTEADNLAVRGLALADPRRRRIVCSVTEHHAVLDTVHALETEGAPVTWLSPDADGVITPALLQGALAEQQDVALVAVMWANNETGALADIPALAEVCVQHGAPLHTDAVQAFSTQDLASGLASAKGVATLALAGHKIGGPPGVGLLVHRRGVPLHPLLRGGGQELDRRPGTLNVPGILGLAKAVSTASACRAEHHDRLSRLARELETSVLQQIPDATITAAGADRVPGIVHIQFPGCEGETLLALLDRAGISTSAGAACTAGVTRASHVLLGMGVDELAAKSGLRFSLGHTSSSADVESLAGAIGPTVAQSRDAAARRSKSRVTA